MIHDARYVKRHDGLWSNVQKHILTYTQYTCWFSASESQLNYCISTFYSATFEIKIKCASTAQGNNPSHELYSILYSHATSSLSAPSHISPTGNPLVTRANSCQGFIFVLASRSIYIQSSHTTDTDISTVIEVWPIKFMGLNVLDAYL